MADPTLATLEALKSPVKFRVLEGIPVFDAHAEYGDDGKLVRSFGRAELQEIATNCNLREEATGTLSGVGPGHTLKGQAKETDQPPTWAYARNWRVGEFGPQKKPALLCDWHVHPDRYNDTLTYPHRSVELWFKDKVIDRIALLRRTPQRDLGILSDLAPPVGETDALPRYLDPAKASGVRAYERAGEVLFYQMDPGAPPMDQPGQPPASPNAPPAQAPPAGAAPSDPDAIVQKVLTAVLNHPLFQFLAQKHGEEAGLADPKYATPPVPPPDGDQPGDDMSEQSKEPEQNQRAEADRLDYAKLEREVEELKRSVADRDKRIDGLHMQYTRKEREGELLQLQREGYVLDVAEELKDAEGLSADAWGRHKERIARHYRKDLTGPFLEVYDGHVEGGKEEPLTQAQHDEALRYQRAHEKDGCSWEAAMEYVRKGKKQTA